MPKIFGTPHTNNTDTHRQMDIYRDIWTPFSHFVLFMSFMPKIQIHAHMCRDTSTHRHRYTQVHMQADTYIFVYIFTNTQTGTHKYTHRCACEKSSDIVT